MTALELKIPPVVLTVAIAVLMWVVSNAFPDFRYAIAGANWITTGIAVVGVVVALLGVLAFRSVGTTVDPRVPDQSSSLVVHGVYRYSRNPMYLGFLLVLCAWAVLLGSVPALVLLPAFVTYMNRFQIIPEERYMQRQFGQAYPMYASTVRRWI